MSQHLPDTTRKIFDAYASHVSSAKAAFFLDRQIPFIFGRREGPFIWDIEGQKRLINCHCNGGVYNLGHRHPVIIAALAEAMQTIDIGNHHFVSREKAELAEMLAAVCPGNLDYVIFGVSGGEAIDTAIKIARKATGRKGIISAIGGYHGHTGLALAAGDARFRDPFLSSSSDFSQVPFGDIPSLEAVLGPDTAAVLFETIPATLGMPIADDEYFRAVKKFCEKAGALLIIDEVQTGLGRTGRFWGFSHYDVVPDIIVSAKGLGGGMYPITATIIRADLEKVFHDDPFIHISTTGGADIGCIAARKVVELSSDNNFLAHVSHLSERFESGIGAIRQRHPSLLSSFRRKGLMCGLKTSHPDLGPLLTKTCYDAGLLCIFAGNDTSVIQFLPPLIIDDSLADEILSRLTEAFDQAAEFIDAYLKGKTS